MKVTSWLGKPQQKQGRIGRRSAVLVLQTVRLASVLRVVPLEPFGNRGSR